MVPFLSFQLEFSNTHFFFCLFSEWTSRKFTKLHLLLYNWFSLKDVRSGNFKDAHNRLQLHHKWRRYQAGYDLGAVVTALPDRQQHWFREMYNLHKENYMLNNNMNQKGRKINWIPICWCRGVRGTNRSVTSANNCLLESTHRGPNLLMQARLLIPGVPVSAVSAQPRIKRKNKAQRKRELLVETRHRVRVTDALLNPSSDSPTHSDGRRRRSHACLHPFRALVLQTAKQRGGAWVGASGRRCTLPNCP